MKKFIVSVLLFTITFCISVGYKASQITGIGAKNAFTLQATSQSAAIEESEIKKEVIDIRYITKDKQVDTRQIILYKPVNDQGDIPLIFVSHYAIDELSEDFKSYIRKG